MKKAISVISVVVGILVLFSVFSPMVINTVAAVPASSSIGIIGGADGPTVITVSGPMSTGGMILAIAIGVLILALGIWGIRKLKK